MSIGEQLRALNFHDSSLVSFHVSLGAGSQRTLTVELEYYDWEGNSLRRATDPHVPWQTKRLTIAFGFMAAIEFSAPDLVNRARKSTPLKSAIGWTGSRNSTPRSKMRFPEESTHSLTTVRKLFRFASTPKTATTTCSGTSGSRVVRLNCREVPNQDRTSKRISHWASRRMPSILGSEKVSVPLTAAPCMSQFGQKLTIATGRFSGGESYVR